MKKLFKPNNATKSLKEILVYFSHCTLKIGLVLLLLTVSNNIFSQFYAGNYLTNQGVTISPGYIFNNQSFIEIESTINGVDAFVFGKYSLLVGKQFVITGNNDNEDNCLKIKTGIGATLSKIQRTCLEIYDEQPNKIKLRENKTNSAYLNMNYRAEIIWHKNPFDYILLAGYNNGLYTGIGWRGIFKRRSY